jgi:hypothetical protein
MLKAFKSTLRLFLKQDVSANSEKALIHAELSGSAIFGIWKSFDPGGTFSSNSGSTLMSTVFCFHLAYCFEVFSLAIFKTRCISKLYSVQIFRYSKYFIRFKYSNIKIFKISYSVQWHTLASPLLLIHSSVPVCLFSCFHVFISNSILHHC